MIKFNKQNLPFFKSDKTALFSKNIWSCKLLALLVLLMFGGNVFLWGQATLPVSRTAWGSAPTGWTDVMGTYYNSTFACSGSDGGKFDASSQSTKVNFTGIPYQLSFVVKSNSTSSTSILAVEESSDNTSWTTVTTSLTGSTGLPTTCTTKGPYALLSTTRYVRLSFTKGTSNMTIDDVSITSAIPSASTITSITPSNQQLSVAFTTPSSDGGSAITTYKYSTDGGTTFRTRATGTTGSPLVITTLSSDGTTALTNGTSYNIQILAVNANGDGTATASTAATPATTPSAPTITGITPTNGQLSVAFTAGNTGGSAITTYQYSTDGGTSWQTRASGTTASPLVITTLSTNGSTALANGTSYSIQIRAVNAIGNGAATGSTAATPATTPSAPAMGTITPSNQSLSVAFTQGATGGSAITSYKYSTDGGTTFRTRAAGTTASPLVISTLSTDGTTALTNGTSYNIQIKAVNIIGDGTATASTAATPAPGTPTILGISPTNANAGSSGFTITVLGTNYFSGISVVTWGGNQLTTTYVSSTCITATVPSGNIVSGGTAAIGVTNTGSFGTSNSTSTQTFTINVVPTITTDATPTVIATNNATFGGNVTATGGANISGNGVVYAVTATNATPAISGTGVTQVANGSPGTGTGSFTVGTGNVLSPNVQYSYRAYSTNSAGTSYGGGSGTTFYTLANTPSAPTVANNGTSTTLDVSVNANSNPSSTEFAIQETSTSNYVQADGSINTTQVWQTANTWGTKTVTGLSASTSYTFKVKARNGASTETAFGSTANATTSAGSSPAASIIGPIAEESLGGYALGLTLTNETFSTTSPATSDFTLNNAPTGLSISSVTYNSTTSVTLNFAFSGDIDANVTNLNITVSGSIVTSSASVTSNSITLTALVESISVGTVTAFGNQTVNTTSSEKTFNISATARATVSITPPSGYEISTGTGGSFVATNPINLSPTGTSLASTPIYIRFKPTTVTSYSGNISSSSTGATSANVAISGTGTSPYNPSSFTATAVSATQINLAVGGSANVVIVYNGTGTFSTPTDGVAAGSQGVSFAGGTIWYNGSAGSANNHTSLTANTTYYYKVFVYDGLNFYSAGLTANATTAKVEPTSQATNLAFSSQTTSSFNTAFTAASGTPDGYIVIRSTSSSLSADPADATTYTVGNSIGGGTVVSVGATISGIANTGLSVGTTYYTFVYSYNNSGSLIDYLTTSALTGNTTTLSVAPSPSPTNVAATSFDISWTGVTGATSYQLDVTTDAGFTTPVSSYNGITVTSPTSVTGLGANTTYYFRVRAVNAGGNGAYGTGSQLTAGLSAPTATTGTSVTSNSFTANWGAVTGASSYKLDVSTTSTFTTTSSNPGQTIFNNTGSTGSAGWTETTISSQGGSSYLGMLASGSTLITPAQDLTNYTNTNLGFKIRTFGGTSGNSADLTVSISTDNGGNWTTLGTRTAGSATLTAVTAFNVSAYSSTQVKIRFQSLSATGTIGVGIDDIILSGDQNVSVANYVSGYQDLSVSGTSQSVTGLTQATPYYYRVRAISTNSTSANSNTISVTTPADPNTADYRTVTSGNYSSASTWEYSNGNGTYTAASAAPTSGSNATIQSGHTIVLDNNFSVGTGKTLTVNGTLSFGTNVLSGLGSLVVNSGGLIQVGSLSGSGALAGNITTSGGITINTGSTVEFNGAGAQTIAARTFDGLKINNASGVSLSGAVVVNATLTLTSGVLSVGTNSLTLNSTVSASSGSITSSASGTVSYSQSSIGQTVLVANYGNLTFSNFNKTLPSGIVGIAGTFTTGSASGHTVTNNTINFNGSSQTVPAFSYNNLDLTNATSTAFANGIVNIAGTFTPASITSASTGTIVFNGSSSQTVPAFSYNNLTISNSSGCTTGGNITVTTALTVSQNLVVANTHTLTIASSATLTVASGKFLTINTTGTIQNNSTSAFTLTGTLTINGTYIHNANSNTIPGVSPASGVNYNTGSTINVGNGGSAVTSVLPTLPSSIGGNVIWNTPNGSFSATALFQTTPTTISGNFTIIATGANLFNSSGSTARTLNITGNLDIQGGTYNISAAGSSVSPTTNVTGNVTISGGTLDINGGTSTGTATLNVAGNFTHTGGTLTKSGTATGAVNFNGTAAQTIESIGQGGIIGFNISQTTATGTTSIAANKTFVLGNASTITITDNTSASTELTVNGTFKNSTTVTTTVITIGSNSVVNVANGGTYEHAKDGGTIPSFTYNSGSTINVTGITATMATLPTTIGGNVIWNSTSQSVGANFISTTPVSIGGDLSVLSTGTGSITNGTGSTARVLNITGNFNVSGGTYSVLGNNAASAVTQTTNVTGNYSQTGGNVIIASGSATGNGILNVTGNVIVNNNSSTSILNIASTSSGTGGAFNVKGNFTHTAGTITKTGTSAATLTFNGTSTSQTFNSTGLTNAIGMTINNSNGVTLGSDVNLRGNLILTTGTLNVGSNTLTYGGSSITRTSGVIDASSGTLAFTNSSTLNLTSSLFSTSSFNNLTINGSGTLNLDWDAVVSGRLTITSGKFTIGAGKTLTLNGDLTCDATNSLSTTATSNITLSGNAKTLYFDASNNTLNNLSITGSNNMTLGNALNITAGSTSGTVTVGSGATLTTGGYLTLKSDANGTARIGNSAGTITGNVTVERYIPAKRAWRFLTTPLIGGSNNSIFYNWQNNGSAVANYGVELWSPLGTSAPSSSNSGLAYYFGGTSIKEYTNNAWSSLTNTNTSNLFDGNTNNAYSVFVTGPFTTDGSGNINTGSSATTLSATGTLIQGTHVKTLTPTAANQYFLVANPYASSVSPLSITLSSNIANNFYMWDPNCVGSYNVGQYNNYSRLGGGTYSLVGGGTVYTNSTAIQSGQAFFVQVTDNQPATITFNESNKVSGSTNVFKTSSTDVQIMRHTLKKNINGVLTNIDGALGIFYNGGNAAVDYNDAAKFSNSTENIALRRANSSFAIEERPSITDKDTLFVTLTKTNQSAYTLELTGENFTNIPGLTATLKDAYTNTSLPLSITDTNRYNFTVDANAASTGDRFMIVFKTNGTLPVQFTNINATQKGAAVQVDWKVATEQNIKQYVVEKSTNGINFTTIATQTANNIDNSSYTAMDNSPINGSNYYRILSTDNNGKQQYSNVAVVKIGGKQSSISVYPNPIAGNVMNLQLQNVNKGTYTLELINTIGVAVFKSKLQHTGGSGTQSIDLPNTLSSGNYVLKTVDEKGVVFTEKVVLSSKF